MSGRRLSVVLLLAIAGLAVFAASARVEASSTGSDESGPLILSTVVGSDFEATIDRVKRALKVHQFRPLRERSGTHQGHRYHDIYFCNFAMLPDVVAHDARLGSFMPCRMTVRETDEGVRVSATNPARLAAMAGVEGGSELCDSVSESYEAVLWEVSL